VNTVKHAMLPRLAAAVVIVALLGGAAYVFFRDRAPSSEALVVDAASTTDGGELRAVAERRIFFGHMSVGNNLLSGLHGVYAAHDVTPPTEVEIAPGDTPTLPAESGVLVHALIGENRHPVDKLANFDATLRGGLADQVDVAALKFCYADVRWHSDVDALFTRYQETLAQLEADYPRVRFVHMTVPLTIGPVGLKDHLKVMVGRDDNAARERYNDLMREAYGPDRLFDLAALEATEPDGVLRKRELFAGYSSDGGHLNDVGAAHAAAGLVGFLAADQG
jgi:hypothetical protein